MENTTKTNLQVGIFLSVGLAVILVSIFMLGADKALLKSHDHLHAHFDQVQGLAEGSVVSLSGVVVGNVSKILFIEETNYLDVVLQIDHQYLYKFTKGTQVEIRTQGALGDKYVFVIPGDPKAEPLKNGDSLDVAKATDIIGIFAERGKEAERIFDIMNELYRITKTINADNRLDKIMGNMVTASANLRDAAGEAQKFTADMNGQGSQSKIKNSLERMESILTKLDRGSGTLGALINDPSLHEQLKGMLGASAQKSHIKSLIRTSIEKDDGTK